MKIYEGIRLNPGEKTGSEVKVTVNGRPLQHHIEHSPTGFCWGYGGSGPADLALSILWDFLGAKPLVGMYMDFKFDFVATWRAKWGLNSEEIGNWINQWHNKMTKKEEMNIISKIVDRAFNTEMQAHYGSKLDMFMDIEAVHNDCPLNLQRLLEADNLNFFHDVIGIYQNLNRQTKKLENCFVPRFTSNVLSI